MGRWGDTFIDGILGAKDKITVGEKKYLVATTDYENKILLLGDPDRNATLRGIDIELDSSNNVNINAKQNVVIYSLNGNSSVTSKNNVVLTAGKIAAINAPAITISDDNYGTEDPSTRIKNPVTGQVYFKIIS